LINSVSSREKGDGKTFTRLPWSLGWYEAQHEQRDSGMVSAYRSGDYTMREIADWFGVHYATVSRALKKAENA
jgi:predicted DNA-binding protein YlxM (UPF0122 family)